MISVIVPFHNEKENLPILIKKLKEIFENIEEQYELILVDDGSTDASSSELKAKSGTLKVIRHRMRLGKGKALETGFNVSSGDTIIFMDADLQDDPDDIPIFLQKLSGGYDFVNGWRKDRRDPISKTLPSSIFNFLLLKTFLKSQFHDVNCGFKAMKREVLEEIPLYGDNYRFLPILAEKQGFQTTEVVVKHAPRLHGKSKYGFVRIFYGFFDTITTYFVYRFAEKPIHFFGPFGGVLLIVGFIITVELTIERLFFGVELYKRPLLLAGIFLVIVGLQIILTGVLGELIVYIHKRKDLPAGRQGKTAKIKDT